MSSDTHQKLITMANQISRFMESRPHAEGVTGVAGHINDFWEPRMRRQLLAMLEAGGEGLRPMVIEAGPLIRPPPDQP